MSRNVTRWAALPRHVTEYSADDLKVLRAWYFERKAGYPNLKKFEGGADTLWAGTKLIRRFALNASERVSGHHGGELTTNPKRDSARRD